MPIATRVSAGANGKDSGFTPLEKQVVALVLAGYTIKESGERIGLSERSVRRHLRDIMAALGVSNRFELVLCALHDDLNGTDYAA
jgi:DNA-binding CsgD family transcriptional regulator